MGCDHGVCRSAFLLKGPKGISLGSHWHPIGVSRPGWVRGSEPSWWAKLVVVQQGGRRTRGAQCRGSAVVVGPAWYFGKLSPNHEPAWLPLLVFSEFSSDAGSFLAADVQQTRCAGCHSCRSPLSWLDEL